MFGIYIKGEKGRGFAKKVHILVHSQSSSKSLQNIDYFGVFYGKDIKYLICLLAYRIFSQSLPHRIGRVLSFSPVVGTGTPPTLYPQVGVPTRLVWGGGGTLACGSPNSDEETYTVVLYIYEYMYFCGLPTSTDRIESESEIREGDS